VIRCIDQRPHCVPDGTLVTLAIMRQLLNWFRETYSKPATGPKAGIWQGILHLAAVYAIARICTPWLIELTHNMILPLLTGRAARISPQFLYSHLFTFSFVPGLIAGFLNAKLFNHGIVRYVWVIPVVLLFVTFVFFGPGMYPTMILESNFKEAVHFFLADTLISRNTALILNYSRTGPTTSVKSFAVTRNFVILCQPMSELPTVSEHGFHFT
jgi:hypothetical protein